MPLWKKTRHRPSKMNPSNVTFAPVPTPMCADFPCTRSFSREDRVHKHEHLNAHWIIYKAKPRAGVAARFRRRVSLIRILLGTIALRLYSCYHVTDYPAPGMMYNLHKSTRKRHLFYPVHPAETSAAWKIFVADKLVQDSYDLGTTLVTLDNLLEISCVFLHELPVRKNVKDDGTDRAKRKIGVR